MTKGLPSNGIDEHPAVITRVWSEHNVNIKIFLDGGPVMDRNNVNLLKNRAGAILWLAERHCNPLRLSQVTPVVAFWPEGVDE